jgi:hypothetical protein
LFTAATVSIFPAGGTSFRSERTNRASVLRRDWAWAASLF